MPEAGEITMLYLASTLVVLILVVFVFVYVFIHQKRVSGYLEQLRQKEAARQYELFNAISEGEEKERKRLSEELHDGIAAKLVGLKMNMEYLALQQAEEPRHHLDKLTLNMNDLVNELRELSLNLQPSFIHAKGLAATLSEITESLNRKGGCAYSLYTQVEEREVPQPLMLQVCRMASELLINIHKHAQASEASVQVLLNEGVLQIMAEDNGIGMGAKDESSGIGLANLQNRVNYLKGSMNIDTSSFGTTVIIELKIHEPHQTDPDIPGR